MSLQTRLSALISAIGADVKSLGNRITSLENGSVTMIQTDMYDPWTYDVLAEDFVSSTTAATPSPLGFRPQANSHYEVEGIFFLRSPITTTGVRPGISWPSNNVSQEVAWIMAATTAAAFVSRFAGTGADLVPLTTAAAVANEGFYGQVKATFVTGSTAPTDDFTITLGTEIAGSAVTLAANSYIKYRKIPSGAPGTVPGTIDGGTP